MKSYLQGIITGIILVASVVLFMSATDNSSDVGRYQISAVWKDYDIVWMVDTVTGNLYQWRKSGWEYQGKGLK